MKAPSLPFATALFAVGWTMHTADHMRRGASAVQDGVLWGGTVVAMMSAVVVTLVIVGHERAPFAATLVGPSIAFGVVMSHLVPDWGPFSDYLLAGNTDVWTTLAVLSEVLAGLAWGWAGLAIVHRHGFAPAVISPLWAAERPAS